LAHACRCDQLNIRVVLINTAGNAGSRQQRSGSRVKTLLSHDAAAALFGFQLCRQESIRLSDLPFRLSLDAGNADVRIAQKFVDRS
jgi:hypothetical protein